MGQNGAGKHVPNVSHLAGCQVNIDAPACQDGAIRKKPCHFSMVSILVHSMVH